MILLMLNALGNEYITNFKYFFLFLFKWSRSDKDEIENWSKEVYNASKMIGAEHFKMAAGYCLKITGQKVIELGKNIEDLHLSVFLWATFLWFTINYSFIQLKIYNLSVYLSE